MKKFASLFALAAVTLGAHAQVTFSGGTDVSSIAGYDPNGPAATLVAPGGKDNAAVTTSAGLLTATFLGFEAGDTNSFSIGSSTLTNRSALGSAFSAIVAAGSLPFTFADSSMGTSVGNGGNSFSGFTSYAVLGSFAGSVFTPFTLGGLYDIVLAFNDGARVDGDYDDLVVGVRVTPPVPEPETYALMLAGIGAVGFVAARRRRSRFNA